MSRRPGRPANVRIVEASAAARLVPVGGSGKSADGSVQERKVSAAAVEIGVRIVLLSDRRKAAVVKEPDQGPRSVEREYLRGQIPIAASVGQAVQTIMKEILSVGPPTVGRTDPKARLGRQTRVGSPSEVRIRREAKVERQLNVPSLSVRTAVRSAFGRKKSVVVLRVELGRQGPLGEMGAATRRFDPVRRRPELGRRESRQKADDRRGREEFRQSESGPERV